ncbi:SDR family oxidoreductase [uncultured Propionibacterium sp.]|uniref:SDR family oxidoreductase n=1 Tax=uncultured Propionibacterium sp. TaxID=218066 RepID=UPI00292E7CD9|nr:SDR family oxidoreductase [uncultured Propionibacterium sp.]
MRIFVAGANGRVAGEVIVRLAGAGHEVTAGARTPARVTVREHVQPVAFDLHDDVETLAEAISGHDAVYFLAGSRGADLLATDAFGAVKLARAAQRRGIRRFVLLSSLFSLRPDEWNRPGLAGIGDYNIAKFFADNYISEQTDLDWTIVQPGALTETPGTGRVRLDPPDFGPNPIPDVAQVLVEVLDRPNTCRRTVPMIGGGTPIGEALASL